MTNHPGPIPLTVTTTTTTLFCRHGGKVCEKLRTLAYASQRWVEQCGAYFEHGRNMQFSNGTEPIMAPDWCPLQYVVPDGGPLQP